MSARRILRQATAWSTVVAILAVVALAGCDGSSRSRNGAGPTTPTTRFAHSSKSDGAIIRISAGGGLAPAAVRVSDTLPLVWISGDGGALLARSVGADAPALPVLTERRLSEAALQRLLRAASGAGLLDAAPDYGRPKIFDAVNTRILVVADGNRHDVLALALGYPVTDLDAKTLAARRRLSRFIGLAEHPRRLGATPAGTYEPEAVAVFVLGPADTASEATPAAWPLGDLATIGTPTDWPTPSARCLVVRGADLEAVTAAATDASWSTPWRSGDTLWEVAMRPLLPDEQTCADVITSPKI